MRIGFDAKRAFFNKSGLGNYSRNIIGGLLKFFPENNYFLFSPQKPDFNFYEKSENVSVVLPSKLIHQKLSSLWRTCWISEDIKQQKIEIYHGLSNELPKTIAKSKSKSVLTIHDLIFIRYPELYKSFDRNIYIKKAKYSCSNADKIIAISQQTKNDLIEFLKVDEQKIEVVYQGCNTVFYQKIDEDFKTSVKKKYDLPPKFLLNVGTIEKRKNILSVIKAIHQKNIEIMLVVIGKKTKYFDEIQKYIYDNKISEKIIFLDNVNLQELAAIYQMAEIFIYPSLFEGFGIPIIEAINSGVPVITSKGGCFAESGGENSVYVNPAEIDEIAFSITDLINNSEKRLKIIENSYKFVERFKEEKIANDIMNVYKSVL